MALAASDVFVVQQQASGEIRKVTAASLNDYLQTSDTVAYKGVGDFTDLGESPATPQTGDLWINNALNPGNFAWLPAPGVTTAVQPGDRCIYDGVKWDIITSGSGDVGVESIDASLPIEVNNDNPAEPIISIVQATTSAFGAVQLADSADIAASSTNRVVTADQLKAVEDKADAGLAGGIGSIIGEDPIEVATSGAGSPTSPAVSIKDSAVGQKGAISKFDSTATVGGPTTNTDYATWIASLDDAAAVTMKAIGSNFLLSDFSEYPDA